MNNLSRMYPELLAGGFSHVDGTVEFYHRINVLIRNDMRVLDYGAGRGAQIVNEDNEFKKKLITFKGKVDQVVGVDIDAVVMENAFLDHAHVIHPGQPLPFQDESFDLIICDWVLEHIDNPSQFFQEIGRILKPGGWFCARTPNRFGLIGLATNLIPNSLHIPLLKRLQPERQSIDVFPTLYRANTLGKLRKYLPSHRWLHCSYISNPEPPYVQGSYFLMNCVKLFWRLVPNSMHTVMNVFVQKKADS